MTHLCVNDLSHHWVRQWLGAIRQQAITWANVDPVIWTNADLSSIGNMIQWNLNLNNTFSFKKVHFEVLSAKCQPSCPGLNFKLIEWEKWECSWNLWDERDANCLVVRWIALNGYVLRCDICYTTKAKVSRRPEISRVTLIDMPRVGATEA